MRTGNILAVLAVIVVAGCSTGLRKPPPCISQPAEAVSVTVQRDRSVVGAPATMFFVLGGERIYGLLLGQRYSFRIDPGEYTIGYDLGFNACRQRVFLDPHQSYLIDMAPGCNIDVLNLTNPCENRAL